MAGIGIRIKEVRLSAGMTQEAFSRSLGIVQGYLSSIERERQIPSDTLLIALGKVYSIHEEWLKSGDGPMRTAGGNGHASSRPVNVAPLVNAASIAAGDYSNVSEFVAFPGIPDGAIAIAAEGEFMAPTIRDGDVVLIAPGSIASHGDVVAITNLWGDVILRRYRILDGEIRYSADNNIYRVFTPDAGTKILGKVIDVWRRIKF